MSSKYQISVPAAARKQLGIDTGDYLLLEVRDGYLVLKPEPDDWAAYLRGLHQDVWQGVDPGEYVRQEREAWRE